MGKEKGSPATARITYYGQGKQAGEERPTKGLTINVKMDLVVTAGPGEGAETYYKGRMKGDLAWLLDEGMEIPVLVDAEGKVTGIDQDQLAPILDERQDELDAAHKEQSSLTYDIPKKSELSDAKDIAGEAIKGVRGLFKRKG